MADILRFIINDERTPRQKLLFRKGYETTKRNRTFPILRNRL